MDQKVCIICGTHKEDGLYIYDQYLCIDCEQEIVQTNVEDTKYTYFIHKLRKLWIKKEA